MSFGLFSVIFNQSKLLGIIMKISNKTRYGVQALVYLAQKDDTCPLKEIAQEENISFSYLEKIFAALKKAGLVKVKRGFRGGYFLSKKPKNISVAEIFRVLEGGTTIISCQKGDHKCQKQKDCLVKPFWKKLEETFQKTLKSTTLFNLINK